jgi:hypothetical protein
MRPALHIYLDYRLQNYYMLAWLNSMLIALLPLSLSLARLYNSLTIFVVGNEKQGSIASVKISKP